MNSDKTQTGRTIPFLETIDNSSEADASPAAPDSGEDQRSKGTRPQKVRRRLVKLSAMLTIILPTLIASLYYGLIASDQYAVEVRFAVRGINSTGGNDLLGMVTGVPSAGSTVADSYILMDYIHSQEILKKLRQKMPLNKIFSSEKADYLSSFNPEAPIEEFVEYWRKMISISFDSSSQIVVIEVRAFSPMDAKILAEAVLDLSEELVNELSARARSDAVKHAENEVDRMEKRLLKSRQAVRAFREKEQVIDPSKTAESRLVLLARLEGELAIEKAKLSSLRQFMDNTSPRIKVLVAKIEALSGQVRSERARLGQVGAGTTKAGGSLTGLLEDYQVLLMDQEFSEKAYISTLSSLETARLEAGRQQRYLATFVRASLPEDSLYPKRLLNIFLTLVISMIVWAIATLIVYAVRDHAT